MVPDPEIISIASPAAGTVGIRSGPAGAGDSAQSRQGLFGLLPHVVLRILERGSQRIHRSGVADLPQGLVGSLPRVGVFFRSRCFAVL